MSGGSYDYLCFADSDQVFGRWEVLARMADRLDRLCPEGAAETRLFLDGEGGLADAVEKHLERLKPLWKAVEWRDSGDWGDDQVTEAVQEFRALGPTHGQLDDAGRIHEVRKLVDGAADLLTAAMNRTLTGAAPLPDPVPAPPDDSVTYRTGKPDSCTVYQVNPPFGEHSRGVMFNEHAAQVTVTALNEWEQRHPYGNDGVRRDVFVELLHSISLHIGWHEVTSKLTTEQRDLWADMVDAHSVRIGLPHIKAPRWWRE